MRAHSAFRFLAPGVAALLLALAAGCSTTQPPAEDDDAATGTAAPAPEPMPAPDPEPAAHAELPDLPPATVGCDPAPVVEGMLGQPADAALQSRARVAAGAGTLRVIRTGTAVTDDYRPGRLNLQVDAGDLLSGAYCG